MATFQEEMLSRRGSLMVVVAMTLIAFGVRLHSVDFALPFFQESDPHIFEQIGLLRHGDLTPELMQKSSLYPHLLGRIVVLFEDPLLPPANPEAMTLEQHLAHAGGLHVLVRSIVALASVFLIPGTWLLARRLFSPGWALFAAALVATSLLNLQFGQQARPHSFAAPFFVFAVAAAVRMRNRPDLGSWLLCGLACGLSMAALQNGIATLIPVAVAFLLRERPRRWLEWRAIPAVLIMALCVRVFWPFAFVSAPGVETGVEAGTIRVSDQTMSFSEFTGEGFETVLLTLWYYEPVQLLLAGVGVPVLAAALTRWRSLDPVRAKDALVIAAYAVPFALVIGMHERAQQRFVIPLLPYVALLGTLGLSGVLRWVLGGKPNEAFIARSVAAMTLAVPVLATAGFARVRSTPHTLGSVAAWITENVDPATERVGLHNLYDLPLVRRLENQFVGGEWGGEVRKPALYGTPWAYYQHSTIGPDWDGTRWWIEPLYHQGEVNLREVMDDPEAYLRGLELDVVVLPGEYGASFHPLLGAMRETAMRIGTLEAVYPESERMRIEQHHVGLDTPHYTRFVLTAPQLGPEVEIYRIGVAEE